MRNGKIKMEIILVFSLFLRERPGLPGLSLMGAIGRSFSLTGRPQGRPQGSRKKVQKTSKKLQKKFEQKFENSEVRKVLLYRLGEEFHSGKTRFRRRCAARRARREVHTKLQKKFEKTSARARDIFEKTTKKSLVFNTLPMVLSVTY